MRHARGFTLIELLIVISIIGVLLGVMVPNLRLMQVRARSTAVRLNMRNVAVAITAYVAENGHYADDFYEDGYGYIFEGGVKDQELGQFPINPFTGRIMEPDDFNPGEYDTEQEVSNTSKNGPNDDWGYTAGEMRYQTYTPPFQYYPTMWGLIGFGNYGFSLRDIDADGNDVIFVVHQ
jgi:prepilin-type N-terminal cleavage/methylation domain-containing protein